MRKSVKDSFIDQMDITTSGQKSMTSQVNSGQIHQRQLYLLNHENGHHNPWANPSRTALLIKP
jgi:hypothetical protein